MYNHVDLFQYCNKFSVNFVCIPSVFSVVSYSQQGHLSTNSRNHRELRETAHRENAERFIDRI